MVAVNLVGHERPVAPAVSPWRLQRGRLRVYRAVTYEENHKDIF